MRTCGRRGLLSSVAFLAACGAKTDPQRTSFVPLAQIEATYGPLITAGNRPTAHQSGTGERLGLFRDSGGRVWGLPLTLANDGSLLGCAPPALQGAAVTDTIPGDSTIVGTANEPTGWRGGTGKLELLLRDVRGAVRSQSLTGALAAGDTGCEAARTSGSPQKFAYYLIAPATPDRAR